MSTTIPAALQDAIDDLAEAFARVETQADKLAVALAQAEAREAALMKLAEKWHYEGDDMFASGSRSCDENAALLGCARELKAILAAGPSPSEGSTP